MNYTESLPPRFTKQNPFVWILWVGFLACLVVSLQGAEFSFPKLFEGIPRIAAFMAQAVPPDISRSDSILKALVQTLQMALAGTFLGVLVSLPLSVLASRTQMKNGLVRGLARGLIAMFRTIPDLVWALIFVVSVGLGPFAGTLTLMIDTIGFCGRFFAEAMDEIDKKPEEALLAIGASRFSRVVCAVLPAAFPSFVNTSSYALEKAVRHSLVLGLVGAGGIGLELKVAMDMFQFRQALTIILCMFAIVLLVERISQRIRKSMM